MFKARFELGEHLGEDGHVLLGHPQVPPHLRNLLWLHVCKRRHLKWKHVNLNPIQNKV